MSLRTPATSKQSGITRRKFLLATAAVVGGGLALRWLTGEEPGLASGPDVLEPNAFLQITPDGQFIFQLDRVEMGQGTMTGLATLLAEELDLNPARLDVRFAPVLSTFQRPVQLTGQSRSLVDSWEVLRETGATARAMLLQAAAEEWAVDIDRLRTEDGRVIDAETGRQITYSQLAERAAQLSPPWRVKLKSSDEYRWIGSQVPRLDAPAKVTGQAVYGLDVQLEGMLTAVIARCPELGGTLSAFDADAAISMPGVKGIVELPYGVAVIADDFWTARQAAATVRLDWEPGPLAMQSDQSILQDQRVRLDTEQPGYEKTEGDQAAALEPAAAELNAEYVMPYLAHATMEPMNATAHVRADGCDLWLPTQAPDLARQIACDATGLSREQVEVHTTYMGGGFGRRVLGDFVTEVVQIAREFTVPVKLVWTREDDMQHGYYRQQTIHRLRGSLNDQNQVQWWGHKQIATGTSTVLMPLALTALLPESMPTDSRTALANWMGNQSVAWLGAFQAREGAEDLSYAFPARKFEQVTYEPGMPVSIWRSVGNSYNAFAVESFVDELANSAAIDPLEFRRDYLQDDLECLNVLARLETEADWGKSASGAGQGMAIFRSFGTVVGQVAEASVDNSGAIRVHRVCCVVDCGLVVNPDIVRQQMESGIIFGLTAALYGEINMDAGRIRQSNYHNYRMLRMARSPEIDVHIINSDREPTGVGEPGTPPIAPAVANAVFAATGQRLRTLPLRISNA